jgi:hypothetical protein
MTPKLILQKEQALCQNMSLNLMALLGFIVLAYLVILAIDTSHIAVAKEHCPRPATAGKSRFLTMVSTDRRDNGLASRVTKPPFPLQTIDPAFPRTYIAGA